MPRYRFTDSFERVMHGLQHGVNATVERDGEPLDATGTVVAQLGDVITTRRRYEHPFMEPLADQKPPRPTRGSKSDPDAHQE